MSNPFDLARFVAAQGPAYEDVLRELRRGRKVSHWMWFIFPQLRGLGRSPLATRFEIASRDEAEAYMAHPILGARLTECTRLVNSIEGLSINEIFGYPDDLKFRSSMTLFAAVARGNQVFAEALQKYFAGEPDSATLRLL